GVSTFVPKAHTPFQWQPVRPEAEKRLQRLARRLKPKGIELRPESYGWSVIQALLSRGDRRLAPVIAAMRGESASLGRWKKAYREAAGRADLPPPPPWAAVVHEAWGAEAVLPWSHLRGPLPPPTLRQHHDQALAIAEEPSAP
ncbi:MAG: radical SAM protein, partial [Cyanobium sp.]